MHESSVSQERRPFKAEIAALLMSSTIVRAPEEPIASLPTATKWLESVVGVKMAWYHHVKVNALVELGMVWDHAPLTFDSRVKVAVQPSKGQVNAGGASGCFRRRTFAETEPCVRTGLTLPSPVLTSAKPVDSGGNKVGTSIDICCRSQAYSSEAFRVSSV
jgi:hypothetical protein